MPGLTPSPRDRDNEPSDGLDVSYLQMRSGSGQVIFAMTFDQIMNFLDEISDKIEPDDPANLHFNQIKRILRGIIKNGS